MDKEKNSVISIIEKKDKIENIKKNIVLSDLSRESFELSKKIMHIFTDHETKILFYSQKDNNFLDGDLVIKNLDEILTNASLVFNFVPVKKQISRDISRKIEMLKINSIQNILSTRMIFSAKNNIKKILKKNNLKTPVFEFIGKKTASESFSNFIQPSRIFSAENNFFSKKLDSIEKIQEVYNEVGENISNYFIEEYVDGRDIYCFVFLKNNQIYSYNIEKSAEKFKKIETGLNKKISDYSRKMFLDLGIGKFALINLKKSENRGIFVLNIFTDWNILMGEQGKILTEIFKQESVSEEQILKSFL